MALCLPDHSECDCYEYINGRRVMSDLKMEVELVTNDGEVQWFNPVESITISNIDGYDYVYQPQDIKSIKVYLMDKEG